MRAWTRSSRAQKPWKVPIGAPSVSPRGLALAQLQQARAHPLAQLRGGALGEGDRQDPPRGDAVLAHRPHEALDQHRGLAAAGPRREQQRTAAARRRLLLLGR